VVGDLVQDELSGSEGVERLQCDCCDHGADEALPHGLVREVVGQLLETEQHAANGGAKCD
jgi:hypothetical protein